jgi:ABC-2 type transport system ATP-binding protein
VIEIKQLNKSFGSKRVLKDVSFSAIPGQVTSFLAPNGSGKTTTMRILLGLEKPTSGLALLNGAEYSTMKKPLWHVGALLDGGNAHPARTAWSHLKAQALTHGISNDRINYVLESTGLSEVSKMRVGKFSLGMKQRLGIATAMLGDPDFYIFDEPTNGLDQDGISWFRNFVASLAESNKTVLLSSHALGEVEKIAHHVVVIGEGRILVDSPITDFTAGFETLVISSDNKSLANYLRESGVAVKVSHQSLLVGDLNMEEIGWVAHGLGIAIFELSTTVLKLEDAYNHVTRNALEFQSTKTPSDD